VWCAPAALGPGGARAGRSSKERGKLAGKGYAFDPRALPMVTARVTSLPLWQDNHSLFASGSVSANRTGQVPADSLISVPLKDRMISPFSAGFLRGLSIARCFDHATFRGVIAQHLCTSLPSRADLTPKPATGESRRRRTGRPRWLAPRSEHRKADAHGTLPIKVTGSLFSRHHFAGVVEQRHTRVASVDCGNRVWMKSSIGAPR